MNLLFHRRLPIFLTALFVGMIFLPSASAHAKSNPNIRGIEKRGVECGDSTRAFMSHLLSIPKYPLDFTLAGIAWTGGRLSDPDFVEKVKEVLYLYERELAWFPIAAYSSGYRPLYGGGLYYDNDVIDALFTGTVHDAEHWSLKLTSDYKTKLEAMDFTVSLGAVLESKDDRRFYGLGVDPETDPRNKFLSESEYGIFTQDRKKIQWGLTLDPRPLWGISYLGYYERKSFKDNGKEKRDLRDVLSTAMIPGFTINAPIEQIYNELSVHVDSRLNKKLIEAGWRGEVYSGISAGIGNNKADLYRGGIDVEAFIPVFRETRLIKPRMVLDIVEDLNSTPIPFSEYSRHRSFRGISGRKIVRSEQISFVPSIDYHWPISEIFSTSIFFDYLVVGEQISKLAWNDGLWAVGTGLNLEYHDKQLARIEFAGGSEGLRFSLSIGLPERHEQRMRL